MNRELRLINILGHGYTSLFIVGIVKEYGLRSGDE